MTARIRHSGQVRKEKTARAGQKKEGSQNWTKQNTRDRIGWEEQDGHNRTGRTEREERDRQNRMGRTRWEEQDGKNKMGRTDRTGWAELDMQNWTN
jgi:hypothetical protein